MLKTDVGAARVSLGGAAAVLTPGDAQRVDQAVARAAARAKAQAEKDLNRLSPKKTKKGAGVIPGPLSI